MKSGSQKKKKNEKETGRSLKKENKNTKKAQVRRQGKGDEET